MLTADTRLVERQNSRSAWRIVGFSSFALVAGGLPALVLSFSVFLKDIVADTHWTRAATASAISIMLLVNAVTSPLYGATVDRFGVRRCLLASILLSACALLLISQATTWPYFIGCFAILGAVAGGLQPLPYSKVVVTWFDDRRGLALGIMNAGQGIGAAVLPSIEALLLQHLGWRHSYIGLAILIMVITLPGALFVVRENPSGRLREGVQQKTPSTVIGALRTRTFLIIIVSAFVLSMAVNGTVLHMVALLTDRGITASTAVRTLSEVGLAGICGRIATGALVDRAFAPKVSWIVFLVASVGVGIFWLNSTAIPAWAGSVLLGLTLGAEIDLMGYLASRYFPKDIFSRVYGFIFPALMLGQSLGVYLMSAGFDHLRSYRPVLAGFVGALIATSFLSLLLGPYIFPPARR